ncbi:hypothetical protein CE91St42_07280 [Oscillospiraceae bacterium]|nr:hypothetical protein CE91St42_07280 [Oscillospiraceae bacterium]
MCNERRLPLMRELSAKLTEGENLARKQNNVQWCVASLSLRQKSKIFATSLVRGRLCYGTRPHIA